MPFKNHALYHKAANFVWVISRSYEPVSVKEFRGQMYTIRPYKTRRVWTTKIEMSWKKQSLWWWKQKSEIF